MPYQIVFEGKAKKEFGDLPDFVRRRFYPVFQELEVDPFRPRPGCDIRVLHGVTGVRGVRVGEFRGVYEVEGTDVRFTRFGHRSAVYR